MKSNNQKPDKVLVDIANYVFDYEIKHEKTSYTWNTIQEVKSLNPHAKIYLLIGYDQFLQLPKWKFLRELSKEVHFVVFARGQSHPIPSHSLNLSFTLMNNSLISVSSTLIRENIQKGICIKGMVPDAIHYYLQNMFFHMGYKYLGCRANNHHEIHKLYWFLYNNHLL